VQTNAIGSTVLESASASGVRSRVCPVAEGYLPINAKAMTKAPHERPHKSSRNNLTHRNYVHGALPKRPIFQGLVISFFVQQPLMGQPMTVKDPEMTQFLMSLDDAVHLVKHAFGFAKLGNLFIRKAPASTIEDLTRAVVALLGAQPRFEVIGTRHGKSLYESLATRGERARLEDEGRVGLDAWDLNYKDYYVAGHSEAKQYDDYRSHNTERLSVRRARKDSAPAASGLQHLGLGSGMRLSTCPAEPFRPNP
jgi:UDP-N-acetylglucosamine 4,6-dehydratase